VAEEAEEEEAGVEEVDESQVVPPDLPRFKPHVATNAFGYRYGRILGDSAAVRCTFRCYSDRALRRD
jgi:hypothetical protein